jgi:hypothetical protein
VARAREGKLATVDAHRMLPVSELQAEVSRLKRELAIACEERDVLKKPRRRDFLRNTRNQRCRWVLDGARRETKRGGALM